MRRPPYNPLTISARAKVKRGGRPLGREAAAAELGRALGSVAPPGPSYVLVDVEGRPTADGARDPGAATDLSLYSGPMLPRVEVHHAQVTAMLFEAWLRKLVAAHRIPWAANSPLQRSAGNRVRSKMIPADRLQRIAAQPTSPTIRSNVAASASA